MLPSGLSFSGLPTLFLLSQEVGLASVQAFASPQTINTEC